MKDKRYALKPAQLYMRASYKDLAMLHATEVHSRNAFPHSKTSTGFSTLSKLLYRMFLGAHWVELCEVCGRVKVDKM